MTPGAMTPAERRDIVHAGLFGAVNRPLPADPDLTFNVNLIPRRRPAAQKEAA